MDDFAIRKGHTYNTGIHDLKNNTLLDIALGRTFEELMQSDCRSFSCESLRYRSIPKRKERSIIYSTGLYTQKAKTKL